MDGRVMKVPVDGGAPVTLASGFSGGPPGGALGGIAVNTSSVYWISQGYAPPGCTPCFFGGVGQVPLGGGSVTTLAAIGGSAIAVDRTSVYYYGVRTSPLPWVGEVVAAPLDGGSPSTLALASPGAIAVDSTNVYWTDGAALAVLKVRLGGGTPTTLASVQGSPGRIAVDATSVYWTDGTCPSDGGTCNGAVMKVSLGGGAPATLASGNTPTGIAVDGTTLYWTDSRDGTVMMVPLGGGSPATLASGQSQPWSIAVDATSVYWGNFSTCPSDGGTCDVGAVMKLTPK